MQVWLVTAAIALILIVGALHVLASRLADAIALHDLKVRVAEIQREQIARSRGEQPQQATQSEPSAADASGGQIEAGAPSARPGPASEPPLHQAA